MSASPPSPKSPHLENPAMRASPQDIAAAARAQFGQKVLQISAPGGRARASVRVVLEHQSVIATQRLDPRGFELERHLLQTLSSVNGPVPRYLGQKEGILFQEDIGRNRLSAQLAHLPDAQAKPVAQAAFDSLWALKDAANRCEITDNLPVVAMSNEWLTPFCQGPAFLSRRLGIAPPKLDIISLASGMIRRPEQFVKWDTRPGNAAVRPNGQVVWFDWEHAGRRAGPEDFSFLAGDEFWPLGAQDTLALYRNAPQPITTNAQAFLICFTTLQIVQRIEMIRGRVAHAGWTPADRAMRYDKIGAAPELLARLVRHGADWAACDPRVAPLVDWFPLVTAPIAALAAPHS